MNCGFVDMKKSTTTNHIAVLVCVILCSYSLSADDGIDFFEAKIRPLLVQHCYECHSGKTGVVESGFDMDTRTGMLAGGDRGIAVVAGKPEELSLIHI